jgi:hypothetical protein
MRILTLLVTFLGLFLTVVAQPAPDENTRLGQLKLQRLSSPVTVHYSRNAKARAKLAAKLIGEGARFHSRRSGLTTKFTIAVLDQSDWNKINGERPPYGAFFTSAKPHVIFLPATDESDTARSWLQALPSDQRELLGEKETVFIGVHELGHTLIEESRINVGNKWFVEFLATYYAYSFLKEKHPKDAAAWLAGANAQARGYAPQHTSLEDFERLYNRVGPKNYGWYQSKFLLLADAVYKEKGYGFLTAVNRDLPKLSAGQDWLEELLNNPIPRTELLSRLDQVYPGFSAWADQMK